MSEKRTADSHKPAFPWTARQRRNLLGKRLGRKQTRNK